MTEYNFFKSQRERLGLTQSEMAALLKINRNTLAQVELNHRTLPTSVHLQLMDLAIHLPENRNEVLFTDIEEIFTEELKVILDKKMTDIRWQLRKAQEKYAKISENFENQIQRQDTFQRGLQSLVDKDEANIDKKEFLTHRLSLLEKDLLKPYLPEIYEAVSEIKGLQAELEWLEAKLSFVNSILTTSQ